MFCGWNRREGGACSFLDFYMGSIFEKFWDDVAATQVFAVGEVDEGG
jgi:hypothetical protein